MLKTQKPISNSPVSRQVILDTAAQLFSTIGYTESGMRQIAEMAGMRPASVYYHFPSKDAILLEILQTGLEHTREARRRRARRIARGRERP